MKRLFIFYFFFMTCTAQSLYSMHFLKNLFCACCLNYHEVDTLEQECTQQRCLVLLKNHVDTYTSEDNLACEKRNKILILLTILFTDKHFVDIEKHNPKPITLFIDTTQSERLITATLKPTFKERVIKSGPAILVLQFLGDNCKHKFTNIPLFHNNSMSERRLSPQPLFNSLCLGRTTEMLIQDLM